MSQETESLGKPNASEKTGAFVTAEQMLERNKTEDKDYLIPNVA